MAFGAKSKYHCLLGIIIYKKAYLYIVNTYTALKSIALSMTLFI
jgi:hypothetical protein